jgi:hypothetical protein
MKLNDLIIDITNDKYSSGDLFNIAEIHKTITYNLSQIEITGLGDSPMALSLLSEIEDLIQKCQKLVTYYKNEIEKYFYTLDFFPGQNNEKDYNFLANHLCATNILFSYYCMLKQYCTDLNFTVKKSHKHLQW